MKIEYDVSHVDLTDPENLINFSKDKERIEKLKLSNRPEGATALKITPEEGIYKGSFNYTLQFGSHLHGKFQNLGEPWKIGHESLPYRNELI